MAGIMRQIDGFGRLSIPKEIRDKHGIMHGDQVEIVDRGTDILVRRADPKCLFCGGPAALRFEGKPICKVCIDALQTQKEAD